jgi:hypothetical protein
LIIVNKQPTSYDRYANFIVKDLEEFCHILRTSIK